MEDSPINPALYTDEMIQNMMDYLGCDKLAAMKALYLIDYSVLDARKALIKCVCGMTKQ